MIRNEQGFLDGVEAVVAPSGLLPGEEGPSPLAAAADALP